MAIEWKLNPLLLAMMLAGCGGGEEKAVASFMINSTAFTDGATIPTEFNCDGADQSPPLQWSEPPDGTKSFALVVDDPDAPSGTFRHWAAFNIPSGARDLAAGAGNQAEGMMIQAKNDFGKMGYGGACPPKGHGPHRYRFKLLALDTDKLALPAGSKVEEVETAAAKHLLGRAELTGTYERK
ncbi:MAG: YbhB/YbcL family Raf kinase inhibitor-like protein [Sphingomicrobium sp.]